MMYINYVKMTSFFKKPKLVMLRIMSKKSKEKNHPAFGKFKSAENKILH